MLAISQASQLECIAHRICTASLRYDVSRVNKLSVEHLSLHRPSLCNIPFTIKKSNILLKSPTPFEISDGEENKPFCVPIPTSQTSERQRVEWLRISTFPSGVSVVCFGGFFVFFCCFFWGGGFLLAWAWHVCRTANKWAFFFCFLNCRLWDLEDWTVGKEALYLLFYCSPIMSWVMLRSEVPLWQKHKILLRSRTLVLRSTNLCLSWR